MDSARNTVSNEAISMNQIFDEPISMNQILDEPILMNRNLDNMVHWTGYIRNTVQWAGIYSEQILSKNSTRSGAPLFPKFCVPTRLKHSSPPSFP